MNDTDGIRRLMMAVERLEDAADKQARQMADGLQQAQQVDADMPRQRADGLDGRTVDQYGGQRGDDLPERQ